MQNSDLRLPIAQSNSVRICYLVSNGRLHCYTADAPKPLSSEVRRLLVSFYEQLQRAPAARLPKRLEGFELAGNGIGAGSGIPYADYRQSKSRSKSST